MISFCLALLGASLLAQQPTLNETVEVRLIEFDAVVTDRKGNPVSGLGPDDFELLENGRPQEISNFSEYRESEEVAAALSETAAETSPVYGQPRTMVVLVDALRLSERERRKLFTDLRTLVERTMRDGDRGQVLTWHDRHGLGVLTPMTFARSEIVGALTTAETTLHADAPDVLSAAEVNWFREEAVEPDPQGGPKLDGEAHAQWTVRQAAERELGVMRRKTAAMQRILPAIADPAYRNVLIYVSGGFPMIAGRGAFSGMQTRISSIEEEDFSTVDMLQAITRTANAHGVILYALRPEVSTSAARIRSGSNYLELELADPFSLGTVDSSDRTFGGTEPIAPRLPEGAQDFTMMQNDAQALGILARETGGTVAVGSGITDAIDRIANDLGSYYTLAYRATSDGSDRERRVELRPKNRNHVVRMRKTILDRSDATRARDLLVARLFEQGSGGDIEFEIETGAGQPAASNQVLIPIELTIPVEQLQFENEEDDLAARFSVLLVAGANIGQITRLKEDSRRIVLEQGTQPVGVVRYQFQLQAASEPTNVSIAVFDEKSGLAGVQSIMVEGGQVHGDAVSSGSEADTAWREAMQRANEERRPIIVYFRPRLCNGCGRFERESLKHPTIQRRLSDVVFVELPATAGEISRVWSSRGPGIGLFDRLGNFRLHFDGIPDTVTFGVILNDVGDITPHLERAAAAIENGEPDDGELDAAIAYMMLGRWSDARAALDRAIAEGKPETRQYGRIARALLEQQDGRAALALEELDRIITEALTPHIAGEAWLTIGVIHSLDGEEEKAALALSTARELLDGESRIADTSDYALAMLDRAPERTGTIVIVPPETQVLSGPFALRTRVASADVAAVAFELDGVEVATVRSPPFSTTVDFGRVPERRTIRVVAFDGLGIEIGRDELTVNEGGERFWLRLIEPREGEVDGPTRVTMALRSPVTEQVERVTVSWNDEVRAVVTSPPWETMIRIPAGELGVLRGVARLSDGRAAEDAVLLNAQGHVERADVPLVELPVTLNGEGAAEVRLVKNEISVRERGRRLVVDSIQNAAEAPLTVGLVIDISGSMEKSLLDVLEAADAFLETVLTDRDRAYLISFATRAKLVQPPTSDKTLLRQSIMSLRSGGSTSLYDAIAVGLLQLEGVKGRRALVVFTDGMDQTSRYGATDVGELARRTHVPIHLIAARPENSFNNLPGSKGMNWGVMYHGLSRMAESTGGSAHRLRRIGDLPRVYQQIEAALRSQFLLFVRTEPGRGENEWRVIDVDIASRDFNVHAPEGYYAPW